jgi:succinoglycan biosynthesis transport protein ExoP
MEPAGYLRALRAHWPLFAGCVLACVLVAGLVAALQTPTYEARASLFVSSAASRDLDQTYEGGLLAQQRARSYAELVSSPRLARAVVERLGLSESPAEVQRRLTASVPVDTVLIDVTARAASPERAVELADAVTVELPRFVQELEADGRSSPVSLEVASRPELPAAAASPRTGVYLALGLLLGLALGTAAVVLRDALDDRLRDGEQAAAAAGVPVLGSVAGPSREQYRRIWNALAARAPADGLRLLVTSVAAEPAASQVAVGLAVACAEAGGSVLLVDANLARPGLDHRLGIEPSSGLAGIVLDAVPAEDAVRAWDRERRIEVLPAGAASRPSSDVLAGPGAAEALDSLGERVDVVIVDAASVSAAADAAVLAPLCSGVALVTCLPDTRAGSLAAAVGELRGAGGEVLGLVTMRGGGR